MDNHSKKFTDRLLSSTIAVTLLTLGAISLIFAILLYGTRPACVPLDLDDEEELCIVEETPPDTDAPTKIKPADRYATNRAKTSLARKEKNVARLIRTCDCRWESEAIALHDGDLLRVGQTLRVSAGLAEIAFACGAKAILEGPAVFEVQSEKSGALRTGRMTANVPDEVEGFTVQTPVAQVVSLCALDTKPVARLTATVDCRWRDNGKPINKGDALKPGQKVALAEGLAEITFACGAKAILQGPALLEIETAKTAILHSGKVTADVPDDLEGFKIRTPVVEVVALPDEPKTDGNKNTVKSSPSKPSTKPGELILKAGEQTKIDVPARDAPSKKPQAIPKAPAKP